MLGAPVWAVSVLYVAVIVRTGMLAANALRRIWFHPVKLEDQIGELQKQKEMFDVLRQANSRGGITEVKVSPAQSHRHLHQSSPAAAQSHRALGEAAGKKIMV